MIDDETYHICERILQSPTDNFLDLIAIAGLDIQKDLTDSDFSGMDMINQNLRAANFHNSILRDVSFLGADLMKANFDQADLQNANFHDACLVGANFSNANLSHANFSGADLSNAVFNNSILDYAYFSGAVLDNGIFLNSKYFDVVVTEKFDGFFPILLEKMSEYCNYLRKSLITLTGSPNPEHSTFEILEEFVNNYTNSLSPDEKTTKMEGQRTDEIFLIYNFLTNSWKEFNVGENRRTRIFESSIPIQSMQSIREFEISSKRFLELKEIYRSLFNLRTEINNRTKTSRILGIAEEYSDLLEAAGIFDISSLSESDPEDIYRKLVLINKERKIVRRLPSLSQIKSWVEQAQEMVNIEVYPSKYQHLDDNEKK